MCAAVFITLGKGHEHQPPLRGKKDVRTKKGTSSCSHSVVHMTQHTFQQDILSQGSRYRTARLFVFRIAVCFLTLRRSCCVLLCVCTHSLTHNRRRNALCHVSSQSVVFCCVLRSLTQPNTQSDTFFSVNCAIQIKLT